MFVIVPKLAAFEMSRKGGPKLGWLKALKASTRNSRWRSLPTSKRFESTRSMFE